MKLVIQRTSEASVSVNNQIVGSINEGLVTFVGITHKDTIDDVKHLVNKIVHLRIFPDEDGKMNRSLKDINGSILSISQFTLYGDTRKGRRPNFIEAAKPDLANKLYEQFNQLLIAEGIHVETGVFGEMMDVKLINNGPVTFILDSKE